MHVALAAIGIEHAKRAIGGDAERARRPPGAALVHLQVATAEDLARIRRLGVGATTNPISYLWRSGRDEAERAGGADMLIPHRSLARLGIPFGIATDNKPADPWLAFRAAVERRLSEGRGPRRPTRGSRRPSPGR